jgi:hypothetical protein
MFQFDVRSKHAAVSGLVIGGRVRLKGAVIFPFTGATGYTAFVDDVSAAGTYARTTTTATITSANHGLKTGDWAYLDWDLADSPYQVTVTGTNTFTVTVANSGAASGNVTVWYSVLLQADAAARIAGKSGVDAAAESGDVADLLGFLIADANCVNERDG